MPKITLKESESKFPFRIEGLHYKTGKPVSIYISGNTILEIKELDSLPRASEEIVISPGLIDNQINGYDNVDFSGEALTPEAVLKAVMSIIKEGVTSFMPTLITNSHENLIRNFRILNDACRSEQVVSSSVPGFHLEGPYISPEDGFRGCHSPEFVRKPSWGEFSEYMKASGNRIIQVTVAPETEGAMEFIRRCTDAGITVAIGHSNANADQIRMAVENGARLSTHLGNGCANMIHRHYNPLWPQLANDKLIATIIADGNHLLPEELVVFLKVKGTENIILTSDVVYLAGMAPGRYTFSGMEVILKENGMLLNASQNVLAGASFPLRTGVENIMKFTGVSLYDAIKMATENVARVYKLNDRGVLTEGKKADIVLFRREEGRLIVTRTFKDGVPY